mgnify:CR=1 FL=1
MASNNFKEKIDLATTDAHKEKENDRLGVNLGDKKEKISQKSTQKEENIVY